MNADTNDHKLFIAAREGNRLAFQSIFTTYYVALCNFAFNLVGNREEAEEIVSDVFFAFWTNRRKIRITHSLKAYLFACVRYACYALLKKRKNPDLSLDPNIHDTIREDDDESHELLNQVEANVGKLPRRCREIFVLNRFEGLRYKEIALMLDISEKTVENQIVKALQFLRKKLSQDC